jgi:hypothetical protein
MIAQDISAVDQKDEIRFELEEIIVGNMPFSLSDYTYAVANESEVVELSEPEYRTTRRSMDVLAGRVAAE